MKRFLPLLLLLATLKLSAENIESFNRMSTFCEVWGFLKYHHPNVVAGRFNWDAVFLNNINKVKEIKTDEEEQKFYRDLISSLGSFKNKQIKLPGDSAVYLVNYTTPSLVNDSTRFDAELIKEFKRILHAERGAKNHYVKRGFFQRCAIFINEDSYKDSVYPAYPMRLLTLARYWNIVNYFYPYKYKTNQIWDSVLIEMLPKYFYAGSLTEYNLVMLETFAKINDSHAHFYSVYLRNHFGHQTVPFLFSIIDRKAVVTSLYNEVLCKADDIRIGDVFETINGRSVEDWISTNRKYIAASNESSLLRDFKNILFDGDEDSVLTGFRRGSELEIKYIRRYKHIHDTRATQVSYKMLEGNIGYVNLPVIKNKQVEEVMKKLSSTRAIVLDVRGYPAGVGYRIALALGIETVPFAMLSMPEIAHPGVFAFMKPHGYKEQNQKKNYSPIYKGKVIILFNEYAQSHAEFTIMALEVFPGAIKVGSQTAGADGNVTWITLPGNYRTSISGMGVYYPNGRETQQVGIEPDYFIKPGIEGIRAGKDEVLEKAIQVINNNNK